MDEAEEENSHPTNILEDEVDDKNKLLINEEEVSPKGRARSTSSALKPRKKKRTFHWHTLQVFLSPQDADDFLRNQKTLVVHRKNLDASVQATILLSKTDKSIHSNDLCRAM